MLRAIREIKPRYIVGENVSGLLSWNGGLVFNEVQVDLENEGYEVQPVILPAASVNAPHRRDRVWFVAHAVNGRYRNKREQDRETDGVQEQHREAVRAGMSDGTDTGSTPDTESKRQSSQQTGTTEFQTPSGSGLYGRGCVEQHQCFEQFPTQSPVCSRDDGFSSRLDFDAVWEGVNPRKPYITFSKWRNESIKAYGNAIVPQVAYEIFKVIDKIESCPPGGDD
jgi:DNA (cytosine-5)-methyltransferase 1